MGYKGTSKFGKSKDSHGPKRASKNFELFDAKCARCGKDCQIPFRPTNGRPVFCRDCFNKGDAPSTKQSSHSPDGLDEINEKLDKIMAALKID